VSDRSVDAFAPRSGVALFALFVFSAFLTPACGKKGPPLPPLVKLPAAPVDLTAERSGDTVDLTFTIPITNTDGTHPANIERADVYAITVPPLTPPQALTDEVIEKFGTKVGEIAVKAPRDPNLTADPDDPSDEVDPPEGDGLDQGVVARVEEDLDDSVREPIELPRDPLAPHTQKPADDLDRPLVGPVGDPPARTYAVVGYSTRGKRGPMSKRVTVPLVPPPPPPPGAPIITYDERAITVTWPKTDLEIAPAAADVLPSRVFGVNRPSIAYTIYDESNPEAPAKLTSTPVTDTKYSDARIAFGERRCYSVRTAARIAGTTIESEPGPTKCETLVDTFPPTAPTGLATIASDGAISVIWEPNPEKDLAGYVVLRGTSAASLVQITPSPIQATSFTDGVASGATYTYAVRAVDKAGNMSPPSASQTETAR
jgi:hypothetical protein